jgi:hypothetical protein
MANPTEDLKSWKALGGTAPVRVAEALSAASRRFDAYRTANRVAQR